MPDQGHGFVAAGTLGGWGWSLREGRGGFPIQQRGNALEACLGRGTEPGKVTHALESPRQDMLEQAVDESFGAQEDGAGPALVVAVGEGDGVAVIAHDALGAEGGAVDVMWGFGCGGGAGFPVRECRGPGWRGFRRRAGRSDT